MKHLLAILLLYAAVDVMSLKLSKGTKKGLDSNSSSPSKIILNGLSQPKLERPHAPVKLHNFSAMPRASKLVWFVGGSADSNAVRDGCDEKFKQKVGDMDVHFYCVLKEDGFVMVHSFFPGVSPPPYFKRFRPHIDFTKTSSEMLSSHLREIYQKFGKGPDATVVGSDMWDITSWWQNSGEPKSWPVPHAKITEWCYQTLPAFLAFVQGITHTPVAVRTSPPRFDCGWAPWCKSLPETIESMSSCLRLSTINGYFRTTHPLADFNSIVKNTHRILGGTLRQWYEDDFHPGKQLNLAFLNNVLAWANDL